MNPRKLLDWRKLLIYTHRWMGIAFGLLFVSWFISGIAFMYWTMPEFSEEERLAHQGPVDLSSATLNPAEAADAAGLWLIGLRIEMHEGRPVYRMGGVPVYADTGEFVQFGADPDRALDIIRDWVPEHAGTVRYDAYLEDSDQWTLQSAQVQHMPLHRIAVGDDRATVYYVAEGTGDIVMKTDRESRFKGFWSGVLHWVYFVPLRQHGNAWNLFIIWGSFAGGLMCLTGLGIGIWRLSPTRRFRQKRQRSFTPYSGLMRWHHYSGLLFGLVSFTWIISGALSVNPYGIFSRDEGLSWDQYEIITGGPEDFDSVTLADLRSGLAGIAQHFPAKEVDVGQFRGKLYLAAARPPSTPYPVVGNGPIERRMVWLDSPEAGTFTRFAGADIEAIADELSVGLPVEDRIWLNAYDNYYRSRDNVRPLPVLRVRYLDEERRWLYLDPHDATIYEENRSRRARRWLYNAFHEFDIPILYESRPLWDTAVILLSIGGIVSSGTTLWPMAKRLFRHLRRLTRYVT